LEKIVLQELIVLAKKKVAYNDRDWRWKSK
jgi:hypothetical protein